MKVRHLIDPEIYEAGLRVDIPFRTADDFRKKDGADRNQLQGTRSEKMRCREYMITKRDGQEMRVCVYSPLESFATPLPGILYAHGGGFACGLPETSMPIYERLMEWEPCIIVSPDYRLSIYEPFPAAIEDCYDALLWLKDNINTLQIRHNQIFLAGDSAGGGLIASLALMARDYGDVNVAFQMPLYPMLDNTMSTGSMKDNDSVGWNEEQNALAWSLYLGENYRSPEVSKYASAYRETDYSKLPPLYSYVGACDPLVDETVNYARNIKKAGIEAKCNVYEGGFHSFESLCPTSQIGKRALSDLQEAYQYAVKNYFTE